MYDIGYGQTLIGHQMIKKSWIKMADQILLKIIDQERIGGIPFSPGVSSHGYM